MRKIYAVCHQAGDAVEEARWNPDFNVSVNAYWMIQNVSKAKTNEELDEVERAVWNGNPPPFQYLGMQ